MSLAAHCNYVCKLRCKCWTLTCGYHVRAGGNLVLGTEDSLVETIKRPLWDADDYLQTTTCRRLPADVYVHVHTATCRRLCAYGYRQTSKCIRLRAYGYLQTIPVVATPLYSRPSSLLSYITRYKINIQTHGIQERLWLAREQGLKLPDDYVWKDSCSKSRSNQCNFDQMPFYGKTVKALQMLLLLRGLTRRTTPFLVSQRSSNWILTTPHTDSKLTSTQI